jgi:GDP/UDP-N,N'-diacetylbacillosamine 2-epimerase (hydrolysing)
MSKSRKVCIVTGSRAEYGLLNRLIFKFKKDKSFHLKLIVTGSHLSRKYGFTVNEINRDGIKIDKKINLKLNSDSPEGIGKSMSIALTGLVKSYEQFKPDIILLLGDRYEILIAAIAATLCRIPIGHIHGGELTQGAIDDAFRHSITKMSHIHFAATKEYKQRIIQMGESPKNVYCVGGLGVDSIKNIRLLNKSKLEEKLKLKFLKKSILVTYHPETLNKKISQNNFKNLINALKKLKDTTIIFTMPNSDMESSLIIRLIKNFTRLNKNSFLFKSLGQKNYYACCNQVNCMIGNSSSGLLEMPSFKKFSINIGNRQKGRTKATSVIDCKPSSNEILKYLNFAFKESSQKKLKYTTNPYGNGGAAKKIISILKRIKFMKIFHKNFFDLNQ